MDYSYIGVGKVHLRVVGSDSPLIMVGNCSALTFAVEENTQQLRDYTQAGGGVYNEVRRVSSVNASMTLHDLSPANLARAIFGESNAITAGPVMDEALGKGYAGGMHPTAYPINTSVAPVVEHAQHAAAVRVDLTEYEEGDYYTAETPDGFVYKCTVAGTSASDEPAYSDVGLTYADGSATFRNVGKKTLVVNDDYVATGGGITLTAEPAIYDGEALVVAYTKAGGNTIEALLHAAQEYELFFDGLNEARSGKAVTVHAYRVKLGATNGLNLIGEEYYAGEQTGAVLKDTSKNGVSVSQYFRAQLVE